MDDSEGTLKKFIMKKVEQEIDSEVRTILSNNFQSRRLGEGSEIKLEDILHEVHISNTSGYFKRLKNKYEHLSSKNWEISAYDIKDIAQGFFNAANPKNHDSVLSYALFSDYLVSNSAEFEDISKIFQKELDLIEFRVSRLEEVMQGRKRSIRVKLFSKLPKKLACLLNEPGKRGKFGKALKSYLKTENKLSYFNQEKNQTKEEVDSSLFGGKRIRLMGLGLADKLMRRYQQEFYSHKDSHSVLLKVSEYRADYTRQLVELENKDTHCSLYIDALVKNARLIKEPTKRIKILNKAEPYLKMIDSQSNDEFSTSLLPYLSVSSLTELEAHGEIRWEHIPLVYNIMRDLNKKARKIIKLPDSDQNIDLGGMAHIIRHSNEEFSEFLKSIKGKEGFMDCLKPFSNSPMNDFEELYADFLSISQELLSMKKIPSWDKSSYKYNPYSQRRL